MKAQRNQWVNELMSLRENFRVFQEEVTMKLAINSQSSPLLYNHVQPHVYDYLVYLTRKELAYSNAAEGIWESSEETWG